MRAFRCRCYISRLLTRQVPPGSSPGLLPPWTPTCRSAALAPTIQASPTGRTEGAISLLSSLLKYRVDSLLLLDLAHPTSPPWAPTMWKHVLFLR